MFQNHTKAKYAYVYMAQSLDQSIPAFCLACFGTDNRFIAEHVLMRWNKIREQCKKRGIRVISFGGDGDSRLMKAMRLSVSLFSNHFELKQNPALTVPMNMDAVEIPSVWNDWFWIKRPSSVVYVQDVVHIAVKLKSRLLKPSIVLPMGNYVAGAHHLHIIQTTLGKNVHGLRAKDIDHKDIQNFDAVSHIIRASPFLDQLPDAAATKAFIILIQCVIDAYLDKELDPLSKMWYVIFFVRYWRKWILKQPHYTLQKNFITQNAYMCLELNAHAIILILITLRDSNNDESYLPWLLGISVL